MHKILHICIVKIHTNLYNGIITQGITSLFLSVKFLMYLMAPIDFTNDQNDIRSYLRLQLHIKDQHKHER